MGLKKAQKPFRIHDERVHLDLPWRAYLTERKAIDKALTLIYDLKTGHSYTVYDARSSRACMQVTRRVSGFDFYYDPKGRYYDPINT